MNHEAESTDAPTRVALLNSTEEAEQRLWSEGGRSPSLGWSQWETGGTPGLDGRRQPSLGWHDSSGASVTFFDGPPNDLAGSSLSSYTGTGLPFNLRLLATTTACSGVAGPEVLNPESVTLVGFQIGTLPAAMAPRGYCRGPSYVNTDLSIDKNWRLWGERLRLQFRLDFFNLFNHTNFRGDATTRVFALQSAQQHHHTADRS